MRLRWMWVLLLGVACSSEVAPDGGRLDGSAVAMDGSSVDAASVADAGRDAAMRPDATPRDAGLGSADAEVGQRCNFNRECAAAQRCECSGGLCTCQIGARGTGVNGVDMCTDGTDCQSAICAQGPGGTMYCSDECLTEIDCMGALPRCQTLLGLGRVCVRE